MYQRRGTRILRGTTATLSVQPYIGGTATAPDSGTVTITRENGTVLVNAQAVTVASNQAQYELSPAQTADVDQLTATWTLTVAGEAGQVFTTYVQIVGDLLYSIADARAFDGGALESVTLYPDSLIISERDRITEQFEEFCGIAFGLAYGRDVLNGGRGHYYSFQEWRYGGPRDHRRHDEIVLTQLRTSAVRAVTVDGVAFTSDQVADLELSRYGRLWNPAGPWAHGRRNIIVEYEFGWQPVPLEIRMAGLRVARAQMVASDIAPGATSQTSEMGSFNLATAGVRQNAYSIQSVVGLPLVDEVLNRYIEDMPV